MTYKRLDPVSGMGRSNTYYDLPTTLQFLM